MSTKATIAHGPAFHLYHEIGDDRYVYLEVEGVPFQASYDRVVVPVPVHIWEHARRYPGIDLSLADATDDELRAEVEAYVDERIARYEAAEDDRERAFASVIGSIGYGPADAPREEQIAHGMEGRLRRRAYERQVRMAIERLSEGEPSAED
ncbi:MAG: hypothetical protein CMM84_19105 [Rhodothermaceae bacterium]|nr:hypothetical protein [Rhodothermaceae bacterium]MAQ95621.1 hypothetical protein [Rhodothermaceae bacterium]MBC13115.1 hypothetical protein [Rhodothermaceae bacterium]MBC14819.1 hypothetical protein [Rhodothermaceae bacterium]HAS31342.1 hypothetical protein [Microbacterium sp.]|tara:strand:+ start:452 stop:904 length:453 start_codon:yes stop_codon:yes gene_type:complete